MVVLIEPFKSNYDSQSKAEQSKIFFLVFTINMNVMKIIIRNIFYQNNFEIVKMQLFIEMMIVCLHPMG